MRAISIPHFICEIQILLTNLTCTLYTYTWVGYPIVKYKNLFILTIFGPEIPFTSSWVWKVFFPSSLEYLGGYELFGTCEFFGQWWWGYWVWVMKVISVSSCSRKFLIPNVLPLASVTMEQFALIIMLLHNNVTLKMWVLLNLFPLSSFYQVLWSKWENKLCNPFANFMNIME